MAEGLLDKFRGVTALGAGEALGLDGRLALGTDGDLDELQEAPPTWMVSFTEPSGRGVSNTEWPFLRASSLAFSKAYAWRKASRCFWSPQYPL
jgi:hypothetical protein